MSALAHVRSGVLACLASAALMAACGSPATQTPAPSASLAAGPSPSPASAGPPRIAWIPEAGNGAALRDPAGAGSLSIVTPIGGGFLAVGTDTHGTTIWRGAAAGTWTRVDIDRFALADVVGLSGTDVASPSARPR